MQSKSQALARLKNSNLSSHERELIQQYLHFLDAEGLDPKGDSAKRPAQKSAAHTRPNHRAGKAK